MALSSGVSLFLPKLTPMSVPLMRPLCRTRSSRPAIASTPWLLKPIRLISALCSFSLNSLGFGLPGCGFGVTVPTSTKPKPTLASPSTAWASLSKPAARPMGLASSRPKNATFLPSKGRTGPGNWPMAFRPLMAALWDNSGGKLRRIFCANFIMTLV